MEDKPIYVNLKITKEEHPELYEFMKDMPTKWAVETALYRFMNEAKGVLSREPIPGQQVQATTVAPAQPIQQQQPEQPARPKANPKKLFGFND